jgi:hypothetical protein
MRKRDYQFNLLFTSKNKSIFQRIAHKDIDDTHKAKGFHN